VWVTTLAICASLAVSLLGALTLARSAAGETGSAALDLHVAIVSGAAALLAALFIGQLCNRRRAETALREIIARQSRLLE